MRYLLMGNGSIGQTMLSIIEDLGETYDITICDPKINGMTGQEMIREHHDDFDAVINLSDVHTPPVIQLCDEYGLAYMDAGFECEERTPEGVDVWFDNFVKQTTEYKGGRHLYGFGMNPGIIEYMVTKYAPETNYLAIAFETDSPVPVREEDKDKVFGTWCPATYFAEAVDCTSYVISKGATYVEIPHSNRYNKEITSKNGTHLYDVTPHEEMYSIVRNNEACDGAAFIYHAPTPIQQFVHQNQEWKEEYRTTLAVLNDLAGDEQVGVLFYDGSENLRYVVNRVRHDECYRKFGHNATCWQTACGAYIGMNLLKLLPEDSNLTFSQAAKLYTKEIEAMLKKLDFRIDVIDNFMEKDEFDKKILPLFPDR